MLRIALFPPKPMKYQNFILIPLVFLLASCAESMGVINGSADLGDYKANKNVDKSSVDYASDQSVGTSIAFSPDSQLVAISSHTTLWIVDTGTYKTRVRLKPQHDSWFANGNALRFIDNRRLVYGVSGGIKLFDVRTGRHTDEIRFPGRNLPPGAIAWSDATRTLAYTTSYPRQSIKLVNLRENGHGPVSTLSTTSGRVADIEFSQDGKYLAVGGERGVYVLDVHTAEIVGTLPGNAYVADIERFGEHKLMVAGGNIDIWEFLSEGSAQAIEDPSLQGQKNAQIAGRVAVLAASLGFDLMFGVFTGELMTPQLLASPEMYEDVGIQKNYCGRHAAISQDGRFLIDIYPGVKQEVVRVIDPNTSQHITSINPRGKNSCAAAFSPDSSMLLITTNKVARLYDTGQWHHHDLSLRDVAD